MTPPTEVSTRPHAPGSRLGLLPLLLGLAWAVVLERFGNARLQGLRVPAFDTAYFQQLVWGLFHGHPFSASFLQGNFLGLHFSPLLVVPALVEIVVPGAPGLNLVTAVALGAVAPAACLACREILPSTPAGMALSVVIALVLPFTPPLQEAAWSGFHTEELALPLLLLATWSALRGKRLLTALLLLGVLLAKEDQAYGVVVLGALLLVTPGRRRMGAWTVGAGVAWGVLVFALLMPWLRHGQPTDTGTYYAWLVSGGPGAALSPGRMGEVVRALLAVDAWRVLALSIVALGLLPLLRPGFALLALPPFLAAVLSRHQPQPHLQLQYALPIVYPLVVAAALGARRLLDTWTPRPAAVVAAVVPGVSVAFAGTLLFPLAALLAHPGPDWLTGEADALRAVPVGAELDVDDSAAAAVASRTNLHLLPHVAPTAFVLVDTVARPPLYTDRPAREREVSRLAADRQLLWTNGRLQLWSPQG